MLQKVSKWLAKFLPHQELLMELRILKVEKGTWADAAGFMGSSVARKNVTRNH